MRQRLTGIRAPPLSRCCCFCCWGIVGPWPNWLAGWLARELELRSFSVHHFYGVFIAWSQWSSRSGPPFPLFTAQKFRPSNWWQQLATDDGGGKIHFGKVICGIVLMSNQAVPPCYLASQSRSENPKGRSCCPTAAGNRQPPATKLHVDFIVNCIKRLHIKNFIYHLGC